MKHTPGPWRIEYHGLSNEDCDIEIWSPDAKIASVEDEADAPLLASAPLLLMCAEQTEELLKALRPLIQIVDPDLAGKIDNISDGLKAILNKAKGK